MRADELKNELILTDDGSHSLRSHRFDVPYHSRHGAIQESRHVFIEAGLYGWWAGGGPRDVAILELGFGTGLNALLTWREWQRHAGVHVNYYTLEKYPLPRGAVETLNYPTELGLNDSGDLLRFHDIPMGSVHYPITDGFDFSIAQANYLDGIPSAWPRKKFDVIYYDAFAPSSQPELWRVPALRIAYDALNKNGLLVTYCAQGQFKRNLRAVGFTVEPLPGPPGKREMTRAWRRY